MSQYHCTQENPGVNSGDAYVAEPIPVKIAHSEEPAAEFGSYMTWQANPAPAGPEPDREDYS
jgi:hypothetical protein